MLNEIQMAPVAVLFARADSIYKSISGCDVWDIERDALSWPGGAPVIAHPPCRAWGRLRHMAKPRAGEKELALWAVDQVRAFGGVLEHPTGSRLWLEKPLPEPGKQDKFGGWTLPIHQHWFGHRAEKSTLLYICGCTPAQIPDLPLVLGEAQFVVDTSGRRRDGSRCKTKREITKAEREQTPFELATWLCELAKRCSSQQKFNIIPN
ncbi:hypothetical protein [Collimonas arenae]|uniref:hypothetical protein n=1 Tax=Collimonas arenae TaxID=279058 RepID=UPI00209EEE89|nr:hypothetical protein [Collimonas arenae]